MRLVTRNACKGPCDRKAPLLNQFTADIAVIQEIASPASQTSQLVWFGDNVNQGLAVVARDPHHLTARPQREGVPRYVIPVSVDGPVPFVLFAVWTLGQPPLRYVRAASTAIDMYAPTFADPPVVMLGDFNSNAIWDKDNSADLNHSSMVRRLHTHGLVSAYHQIRGEPQGQETEPTFYLHWDEGKPYHIDFCFLPTQWTKGLRHVEVGSFAAWREHSDHRPLLVEVHPET